MTDRELLELAAKAAEICIAWDFDGPELATKDGRSTSFTWNPLTDDGDALRLAVKLRMNLNREETWGLTSAWCEGLDSGFGFDHNDDPYAATRRAIVRAAAEIGKECK